MEGARLGHDRGFRIGPLGGKIARAGGLAFDLQGRGMLWIFFEKQGRGRGVLSQFFSGLSFPSGESGFYPWPRGGPGACALGPKKVWPVLPRLRDPRPSGRKTLIPGCVLWPRGKTLLGMGVLYRTRAVWTSISSMAS